MHSRRAVMLWLMPITLLLHAQSPNAPRLPQNTRAAEVQIPKITQKQALDELLNGNSRSDMTEIGQLRQRQPGDGHPGKPSNVSVDWI